MENCAFTLHGGRWLLPWNTAFALRVRNLKLGCPACTSGPLRCCGQGRLSSRCGGATGLVQAVVLVDRAVDFGVGKFEAIFDWIEGYAIGKALLREELGFLHPLTAFGLAFFLQFPELIQIPLHVAVNALFIEAEKVEFAGVVEKRLGVVESMADFSVVAAPTERENVVLDSGDAVEAPSVLGDEVRELLFDRRFGLETGDETIAERIVSFTVFFGEHRYLAGQAVAEIVEARSGFAFGGSGSGGALRVAAVGFELLFRDGHGG
ncbi:MAG TPA: hypothetical protein VK789_18540 [Bryobacteraceae bacterium]|nr:hypothetical protein [Bryobacteraceae bacterium]